MEIISTNNRTKQNRKSGKIGLGWLRERTDKERKKNGVSQPVQLDK